MNRARETDDARRVSLTGNTEILSANRLVSETYQNFDLSALRPREVSRQFSREIEQSKTGDTFAINLQGPPDFNKLIRGKQPDWYEIDLDETSRSNRSDHRTGGVYNPTVDALRQRGIRPIAYMNGGAWQPGQTDSAELPNSLKGNALAGWPGERWVDIRNIDAPGNKVAEILKSRMDKAKAMGFVGIDVDNTDGWDNATGKSITYSDGLKFNKWLAEQAHSRGLAIFLKNNGKQASELEPYFDGAVIEHALRPGNGDPPPRSYQVFTRRGKAVFDIEYSEPGAQSRKIASQYGYTVLRENLKLDGSSTS